MAATDPCVCASNIATRRQVYWVLSTTTVAVVASVPSGKELLVVTWNNMQQRGQYDVSREKKAPATTLRKEKIRPLRRRKGIESNTTNYRYDTLLLLLLSAVTTDNSIASPVLCPSPTTPPPPVGYIFSLSSGRQGKSHDTD